MIKVRVLGYIVTSIGSEEVEFAEESMKASLIIDRLRSMSKEENPGFNSYNTIAMVQDGEAFVPAAADRLVKSGDNVVVIPFSHGG